jgi:hypothetical protein
MKSSHRGTYLIAGLVALAALLYVALYALFPGRLADIGFYTLLDVAFIPLSVLLVSLVIDRLLAAREREALLHKLNMVVGAFFSEIGRDLIDRLAEFDGDIEHDRDHMIFTAAWTTEDYERHRAAVCGDHHPTSLELGDVAGLRATLEEKRGFIVGLLQNGNLLEHESFTDMLWAVSHLSEELSARRDPASLSSPDRRHLELDLSRAYGRLLGEYLLYVRHLKADYPYLFAFAVRTNPFDETARVEVSE